MRLVQKNSLIIMTINLFMHDQWVDPPNMKFIPTPMVFRVVKYQIILFSVTDVHFSQRAQCLAHEKGRVNGYEDYKDTDSDMIA